MKKSKRRQKVKGNLGTEKKGFSAVRRYEKKRHPVWDLCQGKQKGLDLVAKNRKNGKTARYIEVKTTNKEMFESRWLEPEQHKALGNKNHYIYFVRRAGKAGQQVKEVKGSEMKEYFHKPMVKYLYTFPKNSDFHQKGWTRV